ncbi:hypothetical protein BJX99DRAFT_263102 [Aspergillus californicus]
MPAPSTEGKRKIRRGHTGCRACRKRGKKCDEGKPRCRACTRLSLDCGYGVDFDFRNSSTLSFKKNDASQKTSSQPSLSPSRKEHSIPHINTNGHLILPTQVCSQNDIEAGYLGHFQRHVSQLLPTTSVQFTEKLLQTPLRFAIFCISASNLSMLNAPVQCRSPPRNNRRCVFSPVVNLLHHTQAQSYHDQALWNCRIADTQDFDFDAPALLAAHILLAYYHHASTNHLKFRTAVWETVHFVQRHKDKIAHSVHGPEVLQMWYRLCISHRLSKPPPLLLEGEGDSTFGPNRFPDSFEQLYMSCILGMSADDLIYDILIKTMEIRSRLVVFRSVASMNHMSELSSEIGGVAYEILNNMLGRDDANEERIEADEGFVRGEHLLGLLEVQQARLQVWVSMLDENQRPPLSPAPLTRPTSPSHRHAMNVLYYLLCQMMFEEAQHNSTQAPNEASRIENLAHTILQTISALDFTTSTTADIYTFSLSEILLQLVLIHRSSTIFHSILDIFWPQLEKKARGYEHSHYPTHLAKRTIGLIADYWAQSKTVTFTLPAVAEDISKLKLLDIYHPVDVVVCGYSMDGRGRVYFIERAGLA